MAYGFSRSGAFDLLLANDVKRPALKTLHANFGHQPRPPVCVEGDLRQIPIDRLANELARAGVDRPGELDCLVGGPPCQGFSQMRRSEIRRDGRVVRFSGYDALHQDPRNDLVLRFLEVADALRPKVVLIENVPQILGHAHNGSRGGLRDAIVLALRDMGYEVVYGVLNAADYGVPQLRNRAFFLACNVRSPSLPQASHADSDGHAGLIGVLPWATVRDAIGDLPSPSIHADTLGGNPVDSYPNVELSTYAKAMRSQVAFPYNHVTRRYSERVLSIIRNMRPGETWTEASLRMQQHYADLVRDAAQSGEAPESTKERLINADAINSIFYKSYYWSAYTRLAWDEPALTITANANFLGSGRFTHPTDDRGITMREAARLQSFPDDFRFMTAEDSDETTSIGIGLDMIGEAVPPMLAEAFARHIASLVAEASSPVIESVRV